MMGLLYYGSEIQRYVVCRWETGEVAKAALDAINKEIDNITKIMVFFSLYIIILYRNGRGTIAH
jgi:hypothetical protein